MLLLIPGPVATHPEVKAAMARDIAPWDSDFRHLTIELRGELLDTAGVSADSHSALLLQGCGHFGMEAIIRSLVPAQGRLLVPLTGAYALRMARLGREAGRDVVELPMPQTVPLEPSLLAAALASDPEVTHVGLVQSETSTGVVHDPRAPSAVVRAAGRAVLLDAVSAFGALPLPLAQMPEVAAALFTSNKCLEGMPGLSVTLMRHDAIERAQPAGSWSFDMADIDRHTRHGSGGFRFTPPAQVVASLKTAVRLHRDEGGSAVRVARYAENARTLWDGMQGIGLMPWLPSDVQGPIVLNVHAPDDQAWSLQPFVEALKRRGFIISNFYDTPTPTFRVGCIGQVFPDDMRRFVHAVDGALRDLGVRERSPARLAA